MSREPPTWTAPPDEPTRAPSRRPAAVLGAALLAWLALPACSGCGPGAAAARLGAGPNLPLALVADVALPGGATRFDYQALDAAHDHLVVAHMRDASVLVIDVRDGSVVKWLRDIPTPRGVAVASDVGRIFVTSSPAALVVLDAGSLAELARVATGQGPDGVAYDPHERIVAVSDQRDGAVSLIADAGSGARTQVALGAETGNVVFDAQRRVFWAAVVGPSAPDRLVAIDPRTASIGLRVELPGCEGAHGLALHPDGRSAFVACEGNDVLAHVELGGAQAVVTAATGRGPDVLALDPGFGWLYVAAESGELTVFDIGRPGLFVIDREHPGDAAHTVAVDPATHRVFFPLEAGPAGGPILRIMQPASARGAPAAEPRRP